VFNMELVLLPGESIQSVENNCYACNHTECSANGAMVVPTISTTGLIPYEGTFWILQFTGLSPNTRTVIRIDVLLESTLDCGCVCQMPPPGGTQSLCVCPASVTPRTTHLSGTGGGGKRNIQSGIYYNPKRDPTMDLGSDRYQVPLFINDYYLNDDHYTFPVQSVPFTPGTSCDILTCIDYTGCWTGSVGGKIKNSYLDRTCNFAPVSCDDGNPSTYDICVPPVYPLMKPYTPPNCVHTPLGVSLNGFCYFIDGGGYNCKQPCFSNSDCGTDGVCYPTNCVSALQEENLESATSGSNKHQSVGSLSPLQLFGIIGGCVCFVVIAVVVIYKFVQSRSINQDTFANLQVPLN